MNFSNKFKIWWWAILLAVLTGVCAGRFFAGTFNNFDNFIFIFWFILVLFPIISEINIGGISIKKDIENAKKEIKEQIGEIKNEIRNHINVNPIINVNTVPANQPEYQKKIEDEVNEDEKQIEKKSEEVSIIRGTENFTRKKTSSIGDTYKRFQRILLVENLVSKHFSSIYGENFKSQIKIESQSNEGALIVDGVLFDERKIIEIIETRLITAKSFDHIFYVLLNFIKKSVKLGIRIPIRFVIVSEEMNAVSAQQISEQALKINWTRKVNHLMPKIRAEFFKLEDDKLVEINLSKNE